MGEQRKRFSSALRGYSPEEVDRYIERLGVQIDELEYRNAHLESDLDKVRAELEQARAEATRLTEKDRDYEERLRALDLLIAAVARRADVPEEEREHEPELAREPEPEEVVVSETEPVSEEPEEQSIWVIETVEAQEAQPPAAPEEEAEPEPMTEIETLTDELDVLLRDLEEPSRGVWEPPSEDRDG